MAYKLSQTLKDDLGVKFVVTNPRLAKFTMDGSTCEGNALTSISVNTNWNQANALAWFSMV